MLYPIYLAWTVFELTTLVVIDTDCIGSYDSNYHTIKTTTVPRSLLNNPDNILFIIHLSYI